MVCRSVALDGQNRAPGLRRVHGHQIDTIARGAELRPSSDSASFQGIANVCLERIEQHLPRPFGVGKAATTPGRVFQIGFEELHAAAPGTLEVDLIVREGARDAYAPFRPSDGDIQTSIADVLGEGTEAVWKVAI